MLIFGLPPSDPAPEFEPGLNLGSNPPPPVPCSVRLCSWRRLRCPIRQSSDDFTGAGYFTALLAGMDHLNFFKGGVELIELIQGGLQAPFENSAP